jgi:hypothetical protein
MQQNCCIAKQRAWQVFRSSRTFHSDGVITECTNRLLVDSTNLEGRTMGACALTKAAYESQEKAIDPINNAVKENDIGALAKILDEVNSSQLTNGFNCANVSRLHDKLSPAAQDATKVDLLNEDNYQSDGFLTISPLWENQQQGK